MSLMHPRLRWLAALCLTCGSLAVSGERLQAQSAIQRQPYRVLVLTPSSAEIMARLQGQTRDLDVELLAVDSLPTSASAAEFRTFLAAHDAQAAVWIGAQPNGQGFAVSVVDAVDGEVIRRQLSAPTAAVPESAQHIGLAESATYEQLAIVVRSQLAQLLQMRRERGARPQTELAGATATSATTSATTTPARLAADVVSAEPDPGKTPASAVAVPHQPMGRVRLGAGWDVVLAGPDHVAQAAAISCGVAWGAFELAVAARFGLPTTLQGERADARVARHDGTLGLAFVAPLTGAMTFSFGARLGMLAFARGTREHDTRLAVTGDTTSWAFEFGPELVLRARILQSFGFQLSLHADFVSPTPRYALASIGTTMLIARERWFEPGLGLGMFLAL